MITAYPLQMYMGSELKLLSGLFVAVSNAQLDNGNIVFSHHQSGK